MTSPIDDITPRVQFTADGAQRTFTFPFPVLAAGDIAVAFDDGEDPTLFTVTGIGDPAGGDVVFDSAPADGTRVTIWRAMALERTGAFQESGSLRADALNTELNRLTLMVQQLAERLERATRVPVHGTLAAVPLPPADAEKYLRWKSDGSGLESVAAMTIGTATISAFGETLIDDQAASDARATLGASDLGDSLFTAGDAPTARAALGLKALAALDQTDTIVDADGDTHVWVEETEDADEIRFTTADSLRATIDASGRFLVNSTDTTGQLNAKGTARPAIHAEGSDQKALLCSLANVTGDRNVAKVHAADTNYTGNAVMIEIGRLATSAYSFLSCESAEGPNDVEFRLRGDGNAYADGSWSGGGADYAEYFESRDGRAIPPGTAVCLIEGKVAAASDHPGAPIIGVSRPKGAGGPAIVGNNPLQWHGKYTRDDFGAYRLRPTRYLRWREGDDWITRRQADLPADFRRPAGAEEIERPERILDPAFRPDTAYRPREEREEWVLVGLVGQIPLRRGEPSGPHWLRMAALSADVELWLVR